MYTLIAANKYPASKRVDVVVEAFDWDERAWNGLPTTESFLFPVVHNAIPCLGHEQLKHGVEVLRVGGVRVVDWHLHLFHQLVGQCLGFRLLAENAERKSITWSKIIAKKSTNNVRLNECLLFSSLTYLRTRNIKSSAIFPSGIELRLAFLAWFSFLFFSFVDSAGWVSVSVFRLSLCIDRSSVDSDVFGGKWMLVSNIGRQLANVIDLVCLFSTLSVTRNAAHAVDVIWDCWLASATCFANLPKLCMMSTRCGHPDFMFMIAFEIEFDYAFWLF